MTNRSRWVIAFLPFVWRMLQCFRRHRDTNDVAHLLNAAKYASALLTTFVNLLATSYQCASLRAL